MRTRRTSTLFFFLPLFAATFVVPRSAAAQSGTLPVPAGVRVEGVPPIPMSLVDAVSPYGEFRQARFLGWHPTERRLLIATAFGNVPQIHDVRGPGAARTQLTFFRDGVTGGASYDATGRSFVFRKDVSGGGEAMQLFRYDDAAGRAVLLTDGTSRHGVPVWSRRGNRIAYDSTRRNGKDRDLYVMDPSDPATERRIAQVDGSWSVRDWVTDDSAVVAEQLVPGSTEVRLWTIDLATGRRALLTPETTRPVRWTAAQIGGDGKTLYALSDRDSDVLRLWRRDLASDNWRLVTADAQAIETFAAARTGGLVAVVVDRGATSELRVIDGATGKPKKIPPLPPGVISQLAWHPSRPLLGVEFAGARTFRDVFALDLEARKIDRWTTSEVGGASPESLPDAAIVEWKSFDGLTISGVLYRPPPRFTGPRPVIVNVHGGPELRERPRALGRSNYFRDELGIAIIYPNVRGSTGFGRTFEHLDDGAKREDAVRDIGALLDWIAARPELDKSRVMLTGSSYGGYITLAAAIAYGDRIRCAFEGFGLTDLVAFLDGTDPSRRRDRLAEYGDPADPAVREFLTRISPLTNAAELKIPLFIAQGAKDTRVPLAQAERMVAAVRANQTPLWYVVYQDAGHEEFTVATNNFNLYAWVLFVRQYLIDGM